MSTERDPRRLLDGNDALEDGLRRALRAASEDGPSPAQLEALIDGTLNVLSTGATGAAAAGSGAKWVLLKSGWVKLGLVLCALSGSTYWALRPASEQEPVPTQTAWHTPTPPPAPVSQDGAATSAGQSSFEAGEAPSTPPSPGGSIPGRAEDGSRLQAAPHRAAPTLMPIVEPLTQPAHAARSDESGHVVARRDVPDAPSRMSPRSKERPSATGRPPAAPRAVTPVAPSMDTAVSAPVRRATTQRPPARATDAIEPSGNEAPDELQLLSRAQHALSTQPRMALALLGQHRQQHPRSNLAQERDAMELEALARIGPADRLREQAREFLRRYPRSPHGQRVRAILAQSE